MKFEPDSDLFHSFDWSALIDHYQTQRLKYERSKDGVLVRITKKKGKTAKEFIPLPNNPGLTKEDAKQLSIFLDKACKRATKYRFSPNGMEAIKAALTLSKEPIVYLANNIPENNIWIELSSPTTDKIRGAFFYRLDFEYKAWLSSQRTKSSNIAIISNIIQQYEGKWTLEIINAQGSPTIVIKYHASFNQWEFAYPHICPKGKCHYVTIIDQLATKHIELNPCDECLDAFKYCISWFSTIYQLINENNNLDKMHLTKFASQQPSPTSNPQSRKPLPLSLSQLEKKPTVANNLLINRYINQSSEKTTQSIEQAHKYLWMHSAWIMTEALRHTADNIHLYFPTKSIYIELEQPRKLYKQQIAAFSFLQNDQNRWTLSIIDNEGYVGWTTFYERNSWTLPINYVCPEYQCTTKKTQTGTSYLLCELCQERITHYTTWISTALRMIAGDFQEKIDFQEPEETFETTRRIVKDEKTGETKETHILHRYRIIRYYDASQHRNNEPQTKRGSWMSGRPLAENEYEVNLDAIIYVQIQPRDYQRTYQHKRYINVRGKTEHIEPGLRLQPMTIATFRQLKQIQKITRVFASKFNEQ